MTIITLDILDDKAINLLRDLELLNVIRLHDINVRPAIVQQDLAAKYSGAMTKQPLEEIEKQLSDLRNEWE